MYLKSLRKLNRLCWHVDCSSIWSTNGSLKTEYRLPRHLRARESAGALERPCGPGQGLTRKEPFVRTGTRCGFDGLDERNKFPLLLKLAFGFLQESHGLYRQGFRNGKTYD